MRFNELHELNDSNSFIWTALTFDPKDKGPIEEWMKEIGFMPKEATILTMGKLEGNIKGDKGRSDVVFVTTPTAFHPIKRLSIDGLKWTSDFIDNYGPDYGDGGCPVCNPNSPVFEDEYLYALNAGPCSR